MGIERGKGSLQKLCAGVVVTAFLSGCTPVPLEAKEVPTPLSTPLPAGLSNSILAEKSTTERVIYRCPEGQITGFDQMSDEQIGQFDRQLPAMWNFWNSWQERGHISGDRINPENDRGILLEVGVDSDGKIHLFTRIVDLDSPNNGAVLLPKNENGSIDPEMDPNDPGKDLGDPIYLLPQTAGGRVVYSCLYNSFINEEDGKITHFYDVSSKSWLKKDQ